MPDYAVKTTFTGVDKVSHIFDEMGRHADRFGEHGRSALRGVGREADHASTALRNASKHGYNFGAIVKGILAANAIRGGIGYITSGLYNAASGFMQFDDVMTGAIVRFREVDPRTAAFGKTIRSMGEQVRTAMLDTRYSALDGAKAVNELAKADYNMQSSIGILPNMVAFATAAQEDLAEATTMSSDILGAFGLRSKDVQAQLANHRKLNDELNMSAIISTGGLRDMFETLKDAAPLAKEFGQSQEMIMAMGVALSNAGIKGSEAATAMKRSMMNMYASANQAELKYNGVFAFDAKGNARKFTAVLADMGKALDRLTPEQRIPIIRKYFGMYGLAGSVKLMRELKAVADYEKEILNSKGTSESQAKYVNSSPLAKLIMLGNAGMEKAAQILDNYIGKAGNGFEGLRKKILNFDIKPTVDALNTIGRVIYGVAQVIEPFLPYLPAIAKGFLLGEGAILAVKGALIGLKVAEWGVRFAGFAVDVHKIFGAGNAAYVGLMAMKNGFQALYTVLTPFLALMPVLTALTALSMAARFTSDMMHENGFGDTRTADQLIAERNGPAPRAPGAGVGDAIEGDLAARQLSFFRGVLDINGAPAGSTLTTQSGGAPAIQVNMLGAQ